MLIEPVDGQAMNSRFAGSYTPEQYEAYRQAQAARAEARGRQSRGR